MTASSHSLGRSLPAQPSLDQLRKQAKELLKAYRTGEEVAVAEVARFASPVDPAAITLADVQRVLARAYGFPSWTALKQHVSGVNITAFCAAVEAGDVARVRKLAKARPELVQISPDGPLGERIALHAAVLRRDAEMVRVLMELGANARQGIWPHRSATTAHAIARDRGYDEITRIIASEEERRRQASSAADAVISTKADDVQRAILGGDVVAAIQLLESDLSLIGAADLSGATPLHFAAWTHCPELVAWLLSHGANVDAEATMNDVLVGSGGKTAGLTPLDYAAIVAGWSAYDGDFSFLENSRKSPHAFHETVRLLRAAGARYTSRAAVASGDRPAAGRLHRAGQLHNDLHALRGGLLSIAVRVNDPEMVSCLLELGLDPDEPVRGVDGERVSWGMPLWFAVLCGRHAIAQQLLERGADVNAVVYACGDALSVSGLTKDRSMRALLLRHGARITVEHVAGSQDRQMAQAILEGRIAAQSLNVDDPSPAERAEQMLWAAGRADPEIVRMCLAHVTRRPDDPWWNYVLMHATLPESTQLILDHGVDPNVAGETGYTMLHHLAAEGSETGNCLVRAKQLLDAGAALNQRDALLKSTPLGWACRWGRREFVQLFLERGADPREADAEPWATPLAWATKSGDREIVKWLEAQGAG